MIFSKQSQQAAVFGSILVVLSAFLLPTNAQGTKLKHPGAKQPLDIAQAKLGVQSAYRTADAAFGRRDLDGALADRDGSFELINDEGKTDDLTKVRDDINHFLSDAHVVSCHTLITQFSLDKDGATAVTKSHTKMLLVRPSDGVVAHIMTVHTSRDFWVKTGAGWRMKRSRALSGTVTVEGHPVSGYYPM